MPYIEVVMAKINVTSNFGQVFAAIESDLSPQVADKAMASAAFTVLAEQDSRIFADGIGANSQSLGTYSADYQKRRAKEFRRSGSKVVLTATAQMKNDYTVGIDRPAMLKQGNLVYALGFQNQANADKAGWLEERYGPIFEMTTEEASTAVRVIESVLNENLK